MGRGREKEVGVGREMVRGVVEERWGDEWK